MKISFPSPLLRLVRCLVRQHILTRGYGILLNRFPSALWGGSHLLIKTDIGPMIVPIRDPGSVGYVLFGCIRHEIHETRFIQQLARGFHVTIDVGAHMGWYALLMWQSIQGEKHVFAFEPNPKTFQYLQENARNKPGLIAQQLVIGNTDGIMQFYCASRSNLSSASRKVGSSVEVQGQSLDQFCMSRELIGQVDFVKCDVEGGELAVLQGARLLRHSANPPIWMLEMDGDFLAETGASIEQANEEALGSSERIILFCFDAVGNLREISHIRDSQGTHNVFVVPESRLGFFISVSEG